MTFSLVLYAREGATRKPPTGIRQSMFRIGDLEDFVAAGVSSTEPFDQWLQLREDRDRKAGKCFVPKCDDPPGI